MKPEDLKLRDDVLQVLFWVRGEGLGEDADPTELSIWLGMESHLLTPILDAMRRDGYLVPGRRPCSWALSDLGLAEGGRRFTEEFADAGLGASGHGECGPECDCSQHGPDACAEHRHHRGASGRHGDPGSKSR